MNLLDAAPLLIENARITVPHGLGAVEATVVAIDNRGSRPVLIAVTDADDTVCVPLDPPTIGGVR